MIIQNETLAWIITVCLIICVIVQIATVILDTTGRYKSRESKEEKDEKVIKIKDYRK